MALVWFTDTQSKNKVAVNPAHVTVVFTAHEGPAEGKTIIGLVNGTVAVDETDLEVVTALGA